AANAGHHRRTGGAAGATRSSTPARSSSPAPVRRPSVSVSPSRGVNGTQIVDVSGRRFGRAEQLTVRECRSKSTGTCFVSFSSVTADAQGAFSTSLLVGSSVGGQACGASGCVIAVERANGSVVTAPISFG